MFNFTARPKRINRTEQVNTRVEGELKRQLEAAAMSLEVSVADIAYEAIGVWVQAFNNHQAKGQGNN